MLTRTTSDDQCIFHYYSTEVKNLVIDPFLSSNAATCRPEGYTMTVAAFARCPDWSSKNSARPTTLER
ncbi:hypothetical protein Rcae01_02935 [Novipirellula caenicola]|uniref:Uncharacterized protein n=1 Tax=Novipirellula caenicola TaxID=1536901 RepID=A0ABP9VQP2_9BACT